MNNLSSFIAMRKRLIGNRHVQEFAKGPPAFSHVISKQVLFWSCLFYQKVKDLESITMFEKVHKCEL